MNKHTPGPWTFDEFEARVFIVPANDPCLYVAEMIDPASDKGGRYPTEKARQANARLIAAAPELLEALHQFVKEGADWSPDGLDEFAESFHRLIAKAKGNSNE